MNIQLCIESILGSVGLLSVLSSDQSSVFRPYNFSWTIKIPVVSFLLFKEGSMCALGKGSGWGRNRWSVYLHLCCSTKPGWALPSPHLQSTPAIKEALISNFHCDYLEPRYNFQPNYTKKAKSGTEFKLHCVVCRGPGFLLGQMTLHSTLDKRENLLWAESVECSICVHAYQYQLCIGYSCEVGMCLLCSPVVGGLSLLCYFSKAYSLRQGRKKLFEAFWL